MGQNINPELEQHMLAATAGYRSLLESISLSGRIVLEFGIGTGVLTSLVLAQHPLKVIGYEIDPDLSRHIQHPNLTVETRDIKKVDYDTLTTEHCIISNPPYSCLDYIKQNIIDKHQVRDCILMVSEKKRDLFPDFRTVLVLSC